MTDVHVFQRTQKITVLQPSGRVIVDNAGPMGPTGAPGSGGGDVSSVNTQTGDVVLKGTHIPIDDSGGYYSAGDVEAALAEVKIIADSGGSAVARIPMITPDPPAPGDTRWNIYEDPPTDATGGYTDTDVYNAVKALLQEGANVTLTPNDGTEQITISSTAIGGDTDVYAEVKALLKAGANVTLTPNDFAEEITVTAATTGSSADVYAENKAILQAGPNVTLTPNDLTEQITISASASGSGDGLGFNALNAADYGLSTAGSAAANTTALRNAVEAACASNRALFIPSGIYNVANKCLNPWTVGAEYKGLQIFGEGMEETELRMERGTPNSYFFDNSSGGLSYWKGGLPSASELSEGKTLRRAKIVDIAFTGGPTDTTTQRNDPNPDCLGFRLFGASDQSFKFTRCRFQVMAGVWESWGHNNASEIGFTDCYIAHIKGGHVIALDNLQALNIFFWNCDVENMWEGTSMILFADSAYGAVGGGGSVGVFGGSWILADGAAVVRLVDGANASSVINFYGVRFEFRIYSGPTPKFIDGTNGNLLTVNANGSDFTTIPGPGTTLQLVNIKANQFVGYTRCTFEHNGSYATYYNNGGRLIFNECAVRSTIKNEVTTLGGGVSKAKDCYERWNFPNTIEWSE